MKKPLTDEELEEVYISGINKGETITLTKIIRKSNGEIGFCKTFRNY